jgi:hypothetical protein
LDPLHQFENAAFGQAYGMTEVFPICSLPPSCHHRDAVAGPELHVMSSAGKPSEIVELFIEDVNKEGSGEPPPDGERGQVSGRHRV